MVRTDDVLLKQKDTPAFTYPIDIRQQLVDSPAVDAPLHKREMCVTDAEPLTVQMLLKVDTGGREN